MKLAVSNLAWDKNDNDDMFNLFNKLEIRRVETVFPKINEWSKLDNKIILDFKILLDKYNLITESTQSLFFNTEYILENEDLILSHFIKIIEYSKLLGIKVLVFGSPNLRKLKYINSLLNIFIKLDLILDNTNIEISIEPNSKIYGGEFFTTIGEIVEFIKNNNFRNIKTMIDTHNIILEGGDPNEEILNNIEYINHIHISETKLGILKDIEFHQKFSNTIRKICYDKVVTYELIKSNNIIDSIYLFSKIYK